jgi:flagellar P-ring protein precursor FlgI
MRAIHLTSSRRPAPRPGCRPARLAGLALAALLAIAGAQSAHAIRVKDIAFLRGARDNQLIGYGLVVGLNATGDSPESLMSRKPLSNALERMALSLNPKDIKGRSVAAVLVTATLPPFAKAGNRLDVTVDALGDSISLRGGTLMYSLLYGANQIVYATAQGPLTGIPKGIEAGTPAGAAAGILGAVAAPPGGAAANETQIDPRSNTLPTKGYVIRGAIVEREINLNLNSRSRVYVNLKSGDFTTAFRLSKLINRELGDGSARARDAGTVEVSVPDSYLGQTVELMAKIENLEITPDAIARVVLDERTGTIVMGENVRISPIAISHGAMSIQISAQQQPGAPPPPPAGAAAQAQAQAQAGAQAEEAALPFNVAEQGASMILFKGEVDLKEVVDGLNKIGASSWDLVQVLKSIKTAGALHADLEIR